jgi:hypothetical protein
MYSGPYYGTHTDTMSTMYPYGQRDLHYSYMVDVDPEEARQEWRDRVAKKKFNRQLQLILKRKNLNKSNIKAARKARRKNRGIR